MRCKFVQHNNSKSDLSFFRVSKYFKFTWNLIWTYANFISDLTTIGNDKVLNKFKGFRCCLCLSLSQQFFSPKIYVPMCCLIVSWAKKEDLVIFFVGVNLATLRISQSFHGGMALDSADEYSHQIMTRPPPPPSCRVWHRQLWIFSQSNLIHDPAEFC